jgi:hypothetical protein
MRKSDFLTCGFAGALAGLLLAGLTATCAWAGPELVCELRYGSETRVLRHSAAADPYAYAAETFEGRFRFKAVVLGDAEKVEHVTLTVYDLTGSGAPKISQQLRLEPPFNLQAELPALTGWSHVYSSVLGRELRYGCALQGRP